MTDALYIPRRTTWVANAREWQEMLQARWTDATQTTRTWIQVAVLLGAVLIAYNYSLSTLFQTPNQQTPLAYISLVPAFAARSGRRALPPSQTRAADLRPTG